MGFFDPTKAIDLGHISLDDIGRMTFAMFSGRVLKLKFANNLFCAFLDDDAKGKKIIVDEVAKMREVCSFLRANPDKNLIMEVRGKKYLIQPCCTDGCDCKIKEKYVEGNPHGVNM